MVLPRSTRTNWRQFMATANRFLVWKIRDSRDCAKNSYSAGLPRSAPATPRPTMRGGAAATFRESPRRPLPRSNGSCSSKILTGPETEMEAIRGCRGAANHPRHKDAEARFAQGNSPIRGLRGDRAPAGRRPGDSRITRIRRGVPELPNVPRKIGPLQVFGSSEPPTSDPTCTEPRDFGCRRSGPNLAEQQQMPAITHIHVEFRPIITIRGPTAARSRIIRRRGIHTPVNPPNHAPPPRGESPAKACNHKYSCGKSP